MQRVLANNRRAARRKRNAFYLLPIGTGVFASINSRACAGKYSPRVRGVHGQAQNIRIVNHPAMDGRPFFSSVHCFPRQMKCSGINDPGILRVNGERIKIAQLRISCRCDLLPISAEIVRAENAIGRPGDKNVRVGLRLHQRPNCVTRKTQCLPCHAGVKAYKNSAALAIWFPGPQGCEKRAGIDRIDNDRGDHAIRRSY